MSITIGKAELKDMAETMNFMDAKSNSKLFIYRNIEARLNRNELVMSA